MLVVDCCGLEWIDHSTWDPDGNTLPRQSVGLTPCTVTLFNSQLGEPVYRPRCLGLFVDGFESGDTSDWS